MTIKLSEGNGGKEMNSLINRIKSILSDRNEWENTSDDSATINIGGKYLFFTTDSYTVNPVFFKGGNIGDLAFNGTINDLVVQGGDPLGVSLSLVIEEGFPKHKLDEIIHSIKKASEKINVPVVTGDTKVMEKGKIDGILVTTSGIGLSEKKIDRKIEEGDVVIVSGGLGEHGAVIVAERHGFDINLESDTKSLYEEMKEIKNSIKTAKDITRGGLASVINEISKKNQVGILVKEESIPVKREVKSITDVLGLDPYSLASEGRLICVCSEKNSKKVLDSLKKYNKDASIIGFVSKEIDKGDVVIQTKFGKRLLPEPSGNIVPRIC